VERRLGPGGDLAHYAGPPTTSSTVTYQYDNGHGDLWDRLNGHGFGDRLRQIADNPCPPDVIGVNHYLTSDRFLDHRIGRYPPEAVGGNGAQAYADVAAVRALEPAPGGLAGALREAWERYGIPLAVTEIHNGCPFLVAGMGRAGLHALAITSQPHAAKTTSIADLLVRLRTMRRR